MSDHAKQSTDEDVSVRVSMAIPAGMVIWTNCGAIVGVHMPGSGEAKPPRRFDTAHFSGTDFPGGIAEWRRRANV